MIPITFTVPGALSNPLVYERAGAIIKEIGTGQIAGHVQELGGWSLLSRLPIPGGNPVGMVTEGVSQAVQMAQLQRIQQTLNTVQTLATVGAVASVASLGVSVAGFAVVIQKLNRMEGKLDRVLADTARTRGLVERLHVKFDVLPMAVLRARLEEVSRAGLYDEPRRRDSLRDSVEKLAELRHFYGALLANPEFCAFGTDNLLALLDTQERLVATCQAELHAEFLLGGDPRVIANRWRDQNDVFNAIAWRDGESLYQLTEQGDRDAGVFMVTSPAERRARVEQVEAIWTESTARLASVPALASFLSDREVSVPHYLQLLEDQEQTGEPLVVLDARK